MPLTKNNVREAARLLDELEDLTKLETELDTAATFSLVGFRAGEGFDGRHSIMPIINVPLSKSTVTLLVNRRRDAIVARLTEFEVNLVS